MVLFEVSRMVILAAGDAVFVWEGREWCFVTGMGFREIETLCVTLKARPWDGAAAWSMADDCLR
jgi:hypothetical protein